jgi:NAD(P)-dependent dehydrogenase (short-subunit alcohol dehydrogenase family)
MTTTTIITGGSRGFGLALAGALVTAGWDVVIDGRDRSTLERAAAGLGSHAHAVAGDIADAEHRQDLISAARQLGDLKLLVNNASSLGPSPLPRLRDLVIDDLIELYRVNVAAPLAMVQLALPLLETGGGAAVNLTSDAAVEAYEGWGAYGSSKAALEQLSNVLSIEEPAVRIWWLDPGDMRTDMHQAAFLGEDITDRPLPETIAPVIFELLSSRPPSGRVRAVDLLAKAAG